jgi:hypothetical protein
LKPVTAVSKKPRTENAILTSLERIIAIRREQMNHEDYEEEEDSNRK